MQKNSQLGRWFFCSRKSNAFIFFSVLIFTSLLFVSGNIKNAQAEDSNTKMLLHFDNNMADAMGRHTFTGAPSSYSTTTKKFGTHGAYVSSEVRSTNNLSDFDFGTGDFTIDFWCWPSASSNLVVFGTSNSGGVVGFAAQYYSQVTLYINSNTPVYTGISVPTGAWVHNAYVRNGDSIKVFLNGALAWTGTGYASTNFTGTSLFQLSNVNAPLNSYIDEFRVSKGVARWTSNFTPPTSPYDASSNYNLTYSAGTYGSISGSTPQSVAQNGNGTAVTAVPNTGYHFINWSDSSTANPRTDTNVQSNLSVTANFAINSYILTYTAGANGTLSGTSPQTVNYGVSGTAITANPANGYHFVNWSDSSTQNPRTDINVASNLNLTANFSNELTLTYSAGANGSITGTTPQLVSPNANGAAVTAVPATGYHFVNWSDSSTSNPRTDTNVTNNITVTANFAINIYALEYAAGTHGTLTGTTSQTVNYNASGTAVTAVPDTNYLFVDWSDGSTQNPRTDINVIANKSVTANFAPDTFTKLLLHNDGANGSTSFSDSSGLGKTLTVNGDAKISTTQSKFGGASGYFDGTGDYLSTAASNGSDLDIRTGPFTLDAWVYETVRVVNGAIASDWHANNPDWVWSSNSGTYGFSFASGGSVTGGTLPLATWTHVAVTRDAANIVRVFQNGVLMGSVTQTSFTPTTTNLLIGSINDGTYNWNGYIDELRITKGLARWTANFTPPASAYNLSSDYSLSYTAGANGTISGSSPQTITSGGSGSAVTAIPATGYHFVSWNDSSTANPRTDTNVQGNISVTANFAINTYTLTYTAGSNGALSGTSPQTVNYGANGTAVTANPATGYHFVNWSDSSTQNPRTETNVTQNKSVTANFAINNYTVTFNKNGGDSEANPTTRTANYNTTVTLPAAPTRTGYAFLNWNTQANGSGTTFNASTPVTNDFTVYAQWSTNSYTLTYSANTGGSISGTASQTINYGQNGSQVTATPNPNFHFTQWSDGGLTATRTDNSVIANKSVTASFALNDQTITDPTPQKITAAYNLGAFNLTDGTSTSTSKATTTTNLTLKTTNASLTIPTNTQISKTGSGNLNLTNLTTQNITNSIQATVGSSKAAVKIGIPNVPLTFSQDVTVNLPVPASYNNETLTIYTRQDNATDWTKETTCLVSNGICSFTTRHATEFTANYEVSNSPDPTHVNMDINSTITISCKDANTNTNDYIAMNPITGTGKSTPNANNDVNCNVITNNSSGYSLSFTSSTPELKNGNNDTIQAYTPATINTPETWSVPTANSEWGARLASNSSTYNPTIWGTAGTDDYTTKWYAVTNSNSFILANRGTETAQTGDNQIIRFGAEIGSNKFQPTGTYTDNVTFTAVTN